MPCCVRAFTQGHLVTQHVQRALAQGGVEGGGGEETEEEAMARMMGFGGFSASKHKQ